MSGSPDERFDNLRARVASVIREHTGLHDRFAAPIAAEIVKTFWQEVQGERVYVPARDPDLARKVVAEFNGRNREELLAKYEISRSTFYVYLNRVRPVRKSGAPGGSEPFSL